MEQMWWLALLVTAVVVVEVKCFKKADKVECTLGVPCAKKIAFELVRAEECGFLTSCDGVDDGEDYWYLVGDVNTGTRFLCCDFTLRIAVFLVIAVILGIALLIGSIITIIKCRRRKSMKARGCQEDPRVQEVPPPAAANPPPPSTPQSDQPIPPPIAPPSPDVPLPPSNATHQSNQADQPIPPPPFPVPNAPPGMPLPPNNDTHSSSKSTSKSTQPLHDTEDSEPDQHPYPTHQIPYPN